MEKLTRSERKLLISEYEKYLSHITTNNCNEENIKKAITNAEKTIPENKLTAVFSSLEKRDEKYVYWKYDYVSRDYVNLYVANENGKLKYAVQIFNQDNVRDLYNVLDWFKISKNELPKEPDEALIVLLHDHIKRSQAVLVDMQKQIFALESENTKSKVETSIAEKSKKNIIRNYKDAEEKVRFYNEQSKYHDGVVWDEDFNFMKCTTNEYFVDGYNKNGERTYTIKGEDGSTAILFYRLNNETGYIGTVLTCQLSSGKSLTMNTDVNCSYNDIMTVLNRMFINKLVRVSMHSENDFVFAGANGG